MKIFSFLYTFSRLNKHNRFKTQKLVLICKALKGFQVSNSPFKVDFIDLWTPGHLNLNVCSNLFLSHLSLCLFFSEEKSEQLLDTRQELENMEVELKRLQQEVTSFATLTPTYILAFTCPHLPFTYCSLLFPSTLFLQCCQALITQLVS